VTKRSALAKRSQVLQAVVVKAEPAVLTQDDVRAGCAALVKDLGRDKARLFLEAAVNGKLRGESFVERIVRKNPVAAVLAAASAGAIVGALFGVPQTAAPASQDDEP